MKRQALQHGGVSPPPTKRKVESTTNSKAVANFFTPVSQKKTTLSLVWRTLHETVLVGKYKSGEDSHEDKRRKIAAFDFDSTLIQTSSGNVFGKSANDWRWCSAAVPTKLRSLHEEGHRVVVISNQGGINLSSSKRPSKQDTDRLSTFKEKVSYVFSQLDFPISIYAATGKDQYRKPRVGMWKEMLEDYDLDEPPGPDLAESFFVGDAAGRLASSGYKADHSSGDRNFAANLGIPFLTPEEFFLGSSPREWKRSFDPTEFLITGKESPTSSPVAKCSDVEIVLLCGSPGSGKSTFYHRYLRPMGYERINQDTLKTRDKCLSVASQHLAAGRSIAVDNTNADLQTREKWIDLARRMKVPIRCILNDTPMEVCRHNDTVRALQVGDDRFNPEKRDMLPTMAFTGFKSRYREPMEEEGFEQVIRIGFKFHGDNEQWKLWSQYWI